MRCQQWDLLATTLALASRVLSSTRGGAETACSALFAICARPMRNAKDKRRRWACFARCANSSEDRCTCKRPEVQCGCSLPSSAEYLMHVDVQTPVPPERGVECMLFLVQLATSR